MKQGFDNDIYLKLQSEAIIKRASEFDGKLYLEFGGKLLFDYHAARVLPGFDPNAKIRLLRLLKDKADIVICICSGDIERKKIRADFGITYDVDTLKLIDDLRAWELDVSGVVVTRYDGQPAVKRFIHGLERRKIKVYTHSEIKGYPTDIDTIVSQNGYGTNEYIQTEKPIVIVTAPGPGSGKMATCLAQVYHEHLRGLTAGYAKFETFPIWNLPLKHPVNLAYEAATADIGDYNEIDHFHMEAYGVPAVNYNRDIEIFPVLKRIMARITGSDNCYKSPTDMGVNCAGLAIVDDGIVREAAVQEVIRRYFRYRCEYALGMNDKGAVEKAKLLMDELGAAEERRKIVIHARETAKQAESHRKGDLEIHCGAALELPDGSIVTGKNSPLLHAASSVVLNAIKQLAGLPDPLHLISPDIIASVSSLKKDVLKAKRLSLDLEETLIALSVSLPSAPAVKMAMEQLPELRGCEMHMTHMPTPGDEAGLRKLGVNLTSDPNFSSKNLFVV